MFKKTKNKLPKAINEKNIALPENLQKIMNIVMPNNQHKSNIQKGSVIQSTKNNRCELWDCEISKIICLLADIATNIWRARHKKETNGIVKDSSEYKKIIRHYEAAWDLLTNAGFEICDHTNEAYPEGSTLKVIAFQPMPGYGSLTVAETIKPTIYFKEKKIQEGEVIVAMPIKKDTVDNNKD